MNILCIGDIVGRSGAEMAAAQLKYIKQDYNIDFTIANGENTTTGNGINRQRADFLLDSGVDVITLGNHAFSKREVCQLFKEKYPIIRPLNMQKGTPGEGYIVKTAGEKKIAVINLIGRIFMQPCDCPFLGAAELIKTLDADLVFVDFHAEATSEKLALARYLTGRVTCIFGTHTHVQTADEDIFEGKTAYISDVGMTGPYNSVLGVKNESAVTKFLTMQHCRYELAEGNCIMCAVVVSTDENNRPVKIQRLRIK